MHSAIHIARDNMIKQQVRVWEVLDQQVLDALDSVQREDFVPEKYRAMAYAEWEIPLCETGASTSGQSMMTPALEARILQAVAPKRHEHVLEIGTGSGYLTALLGKLAARVTSVEIDPRLGAVASAALQRTGLSNYELRRGDGARAHPDAIGGARFDVIVLGGSTPVLPAAFGQALNPGGRLFAVIGDAPAMHATLLAKDSAGEVSSSRLFEAVLAPLQNAEYPQRFVF